MVKKTVVLLIALVLVLGITSVAWADAPSGSTPISNTLSDTLPVGTNQIQLSWVTQPPQSANLGTSNTVDIQAANVGGPIDRVLYIVEIMKNNQPATQADVEITGKTSGETQSYPLGYDSTGSFFYWGPRTGFTFPGAADSTTKGILTGTFTVTFKNAGNYTFNIYAVQLP